MQLRGRAKVSFSTKSRLPDTRAIASAEFLIGAPGGGRDQLFAWSGSGWRPSIGAHPLARSPRGDQVSFGPEEDLVFRSVAENNALIRIKKDGTGRSRVTAATVMEKFGLSPDGKWVIALLAGSGTFAVPVDGGAPTRICARVCPSTWSSDGRWF
jgi:hypothetical protein